MERIEHLATSPSNISVLLKKQREDTLNKTLTCKTNLQYETKAKINKMSIQNHSTTEIILGLANSIHAAINFDLSMDEINNYKRILLRYLFCEQTLSNLCIKILNKYENSIHNIGQYIVSLLFLGCLINHLNTSNH